MRVQSVIRTPIFYTIQIRTEKQLNSRQAFCPNTSCHASGHCGKGNIRIHSRTDKRYLCTPCHKTFSATTGTPFYRLREERDLFVMVVTLLGYGCPVQAIVAACHLHERAVAAWQTRRDLCYAQVIKRREQRCVVAVGRRIVQGAATLVERLRHKASAESVVNTAFVERLNATFRQRLANFVRRTRCLAQRVETIADGMWWFGGLCNFCAAHDSLRLKQVDEESGHKRYIERTPAMAAGITGHVWSVKELLNRVPPPRWKPPKRRGRAPKALKQTIERWCQA